MSSYYNNGGSGGTPYGQPPPPQQQHNFGYSHLSQPTYAQQLHQQQQPPAYYGQTQQQPPQQQQYGGYFPPPPQPQSQPGYAHGDAGGLPPDYAHMSPYTGKPVFRDLWAAILYFAHLAGFVVLAVVILKNMPKETLRFSGDFSNAKEFWSWPTIVILIAAAGIGFALSFVYLLCMHLFTTALIIVSFFVSVAAMLGLAAYFAYRRIWVACAIFAVFGILSALMWFAVRKKIPFSKIMLRTVMAVMRRFPATIAVTTLMLVIQIAYLVFFIIVFVGTFPYFDSRKTCTRKTSSTGRVYDSCTNVPLYLVWVFMAFSLFWTSMVIQNVAHVTVSGVYGTYYFFDGTPGGYPTANPTLQSLKRASTTSFGSVCFGSLIVALIQLLRFVLRLFTDSSDGLGVFCAICADCILGCIQGIVEFLNRYAYVQVALYGKSFIAAGKDTWKMLQDRGIEAIINDCLIGNVLSMGGLIIGVAGGAAAYGILAGINPLFNQSGDYTWTVIILGFIAAADMFMLVAQVIDSGTAATFVCLAEDPGALARTKPYLFEEIRRTWPAVVYGV
ncbi:DUF580-domain-containing protein [Ramicandelaber brevisporus]|nr:DUF580-domain-containing protein [Ramicandelaber brevisporus]